MKRYSEPGKPRQYTDPQTGEPLVYPPKKSLKERWLAVLRWFGWDYIGKGGRPR